MRFEWWLSLGKWWCYRKGANEIEEDGYVNDESDALNDWDDDFDGENCNCSDENG